MPASALTLEQQLGQKLMLDFRYFCADNTPSNACRTPVTQLPPELARLISQYNIGGVILFSENLTSPAQIAQLNAQLQQAAKQSSLGAELFISIDQEGGRVARLPRDLSTPFTGNMSIGATYAKHGSYFASHTARVIANELTAVGINTNYAPTVDVNSNPENPVINVRSFGEDPHIVAELGGAQVEAFQQHGVISAIKHFPGHGDTHVDSHTGLPCVTHNQSEAEQDLLPFKTIIAKHQPKMVMSAHIQYPALDNTTVISKQGEAIVKPATMSRKIMTDLLRHQLKFNGVIISDALDMAGISDFFTPLDAVLNTFNAGVDIALMPLPIRNKKDIEKFHALFATLIEHAKENKLDKHEFALSAERILTLKNSFPLSAKNAPATLANSAHKKLEQQLAEAAITALKNSHNTLPLQLNANTKLVLIMPDSRKCAAMEQALVQEANTNLNATCISLQGFAKPEALNTINQADIIIAANATPSQSAVEIGGMEDIATLKAHKLNQAQQPKALTALLTHAQTKRKKTVFISLRAPYDIEKFGHFAHAILASYAYNVDVDRQNQKSSQVKGAAFSALAKVLTGKIPAHGQLPVTINNKKSHHDQP